jgi:hypothetical protein
MSSSPALRAPEEQTYPIKRILDDRLFSGVRHYLVQWEGFDATENTWEPEENFTTAIEILNEYHAAKADPGHKKKTATSQADLLKRRNPARAVTGRYHSKIEAVTEARRVGTHIELTVRTDDGALRTISRAQLVKQHPEIWTRFLEAVLSSK